MLIALNILLAAAVVSGMVALFIHAIRSERRHHRDGAIQRQPGLNGRCDRALSASRG